MSKVLTVSVAARNVEGYIRECLDSLLDPAVNDRIEVLVCDDGGTDGTMGIVSQYARRYPGTVIPVHKENGGYGSVLNANIARARGRYFKALDGDDWFVRGNFVRLVGLLGRIDADYVVSDMASYYEPGGAWRVTRNLDYMAEGEYPFDGVEFRHVVGMHSSAFRTQVLRGLPRPFTEHCLYTDVELVQYAVPYLRTVYLWHHVVYVYRHGRPGASNSPEGIRAHYREQQEVFWRVLGVYRGLGEGQAARRRFVGNRLAFEVANVYRFLSCLPPSAANYREMRGFRDALRAECPELIPPAMREGRLASLFLRLGAPAYPLMHALHMGSERARDLRRRWLGRA